MKQALRLHLSIMVMLTTSIVSTGCGGETSEGLPMQRLKELTNGITLAEVERKLGTHGQHQFAARIERADYLCVSYHFEYPFIYYYFLFRNGHLAKICVPPPFDVEIVERNGMRLEIRRPVNPERRVAAVMEAEGMSPEELISDIGKRIQNKRAGENRGILPVIIITSPLIIAGMIFDKPDVQREYGRNQELASRFNPEKLKLGASVAEARRIYGKELWVRRLNADRSIICWGSKERLLRVKPEHRFSNVCALVENERVEQVYSHDFVQGIKSDSDLPAHE